MEKRATLLAMILCAVQPFTAHAAMSLEGEHQCAVFNAAIDESQATVDMNLRLVAKFQARKSELGCGGGAATGAGDRRCANLTDGISDAQAAAEREKRILAKFKARRSELACTGAESLANSGGEPKKWVDTGFGDCPGQDVGLTSGPVPAEGMCTEDKAGRFAVCWDGKRFKNGYGEKHGAPGYPWCTYKATTSCGGGKNTGRLFKCSPETR